MNGHDETATSQARSQSGSRAGSRARSRARSIVSGAASAVAGAASALAFLTVLGAARPPTRNAFVWFPVVGAAIGGVLGLLWWGAAHLWPPAVAAGVVVVGDVLVTGMLHFDGLVDSADGLLAPMDRERRLQVMREPTVGAFGVVVAVVVVLVRWAALAALHPSVLVLCGLWALARGVMAVVAGTVPPARADSLAASFVDRGHRGTPWVAGVGALVIAGACLLGWQRVAGGAVLGAALVTAAAVVALARRRLGGYTGDVLGAAGVLVETVGLLVAAARW